MSCFLEIQWFCWYVSLFDVLVATIHLWQRSIYITVHKYSILTCNRMSNEDSNRTTYYKVWFGEFIITRHHYTNTNERDTKTTETNSCPNHFIISNILKLVDHWNKQTYKHHNVFQKRSMEKRNIWKSIIGPKNTWLSGSTFFGKGCVNVSIFTSTCSLYAIYDLEWMNHRQHRFFHDSFTYIIIFEKIENYHFICWALDEKSRKKTWPEMTLELTCRNWTC